MEEDGVEPPDFQVKGYGGLPPPVDQPGLMAVLKSKRAFVESTVVPVVNWRPCTTTTSSLFASKPSVPVTLLPSSSTNRRCQHDARQQAGRRTAWALTQLPLEASQSPSKQHMAAHGPVRQERTRMRQAEVQRQALPSAPCGVASQHRSVAECFHLGMEGERSELSSSTVGFEPTRGGIHSSTTASDT